MFPVLVPLEQTRAYQDIFAKGKADGEAKGKADGLKRLLKRRFGVLPRVAESFVQPIGRRGAMKTTLTGAGLLAGALLLGDGAARAALIDAGNGLINDTTLNLVWTQDANLAASNTFGLATGTNLGLYPGDTSGYAGIINADGTMSWAGARFWIDAMNAANYKGYHDWRLPATAQPDPACGDQDDPGGGLPLQGNGFNCTGSDLGHLFYTEGGLAVGDSILDSTILDDHFLNMQSAVYWSGTEFAPSPGGAWYFYTVNGRQNAVDKDGQFYGWAVRPGQVAAAPLPATGLLVAVGLMALGATRRGRRATWVIRSCG